MKRYLLFPLLLTACGTSQTIQPSATQVIQTNGAVVYNLTATADSSGTHPASLSVSAKASVTMPKTISSLSNASYRGRADLSIGATFCAYDSDGQGVYVRTDGSCNTFQPDAAITVNPGDTVSLTLEGCPSQPTSVEATIDGEKI